MEYKVDFNATNWDSTYEGMRCKTYQQGKIQLRLVEYVKDFFENQWCTKGHIGYVLEGEMEINFSGKLETFKQGDGLYIPPGEKNKHMARIVTNSAKVIFLEET